MYFKYPELLYALFFLLIPILVHLFQLRRFRTTKFTNVKFLKNAVLQTRKSSRLKKFLILCTRLLMLTCLILAFAQPYFPPETGEIKETETVIYLDDSYSMQARGQNGILLRRSIQDLLENIPAGETVSLFTNKEEYRDVKQSTLRDWLQDKEYSPRVLPWKVIELKAQNLFRNSMGTNKNFVAISDFQHLQDSVQGLGNNVTTHLVQLQPESMNNVAIDSAWISQKSLDQTVLSVSFSGTGDPREKISVGLYSDDRMLARKTIDLGKDTENITYFNLDADAIPLGRIEIEDNGLQFDNQLFFSINKTSPVKIVVIGDTEADFLQRIYSAPDFDLTIFPENNIDYNLLSQANLIILNQPENIPSSVVNTLEQLVQQQVFLVIIPALEAPIEDYNFLLQTFDLPVFRERNESEKLITDISFGHPLYLGVFDERVTNFEYPKVQSFFSLSNSTSAVLEFENGEAFLFEKDNVFVFTAALSSGNSNFKNSPLIVPTFFNIGNLAISRPQLYYVLGETQEINVQANLQQDEILKLSSSESSFIPQQQSSQNKVELILNDLPGTPGHFSILKDSLVLRTLSFNVDRRESELIDSELNGAGNIYVHSSIPKVFQEIKSATEVDSLWKWFVIFTLFFLLIELLILKFLK